MVRYYFHYFLGFVIAYEALVCYAIDGDRVTLC